MKIEIFMGEKVQPIAVNHAGDKCGVCMFGLAAGNGYCQSLNPADDSPEPQCMSHEREDGRDVYFDEVK